ncbi:MAG: hypothetical protein WD738_17340 [Pirellulales bacterium]
MRAPINVQSSGGPITPELRHELALAKGRSKPIRKAASVAAFNGWATGIIAAISAPFALFSVAGFLMTVGLAVVAYNEFRGRKRLLKFDPASAAFLGWNQIGFFTLIVVYSLWMLATSIGSLAAELQASPELVTALGSLDEFDGIYRRVVVAFYGAIISLSALFEGLNAFYYFTRSKHVDAYLQETPAWVQEIEQMTSAA